MGDMRFQRLPDHAPNLLAAVLAAGAALPLCGIISRKASAAAEFNYKWRPVRIRRIRSTRASRKR